MNLQSVLKKIFKKYSKIRKNEALKGIGVCGRRVSSALVSIHELWVIGE